MIFAKKVVISVKIVMDFAKNEVDFVGDKVNSTHFAFPFESQVLRPNPSNRRNLTGCPSVLRFLVFRGDRRIFDVV